MEYDKKRRNKKAWRFKRLQILCFQTKEVAKRCNIVDDDGNVDERQFMPMLQLFHDLGTLIYFGGDETEQEKALKDIVILDPQWLIDVFKAVITILPDEKRVS